MALPALGDILYDYEVVEKLGEGGFCVVFKALRRTDRLPVAIKIMLPEVAKDASLVTRFRMEGMTLQHVRHPNIVEMLEFHPSDQHGDLLVMEYLRGESLEQRLVRGACLSEDEVVVLAVQVLEALQASHAREVIHRDINPSNLFLVKEEGGLCCKVIDFGISKALQQTLSLTGAGMLMGTPAYTAPERARKPHEKPLPAMDIYSLGLTLAESLTGRAVVQGHDHHMILLEQVKPEAHRLPGVASPVLKRVLERMVEKDPRERYSTTSAVLRELRPLLPARIPERSPRPAPQAAPVRIVPREPTVPGPPPRPRPAPAPRPATVPGHHQAEELIAGRYRLLEEIPSGSAWVSVFWGRDEYLGRPVRLRLLRGDKGARREGGWKRLRREWEMTPRLHHPYAAVLLDASPARVPKPYLVYEVSPGHTLAQEQARRGQPFSETEALVLISQVLSALSVAHQQHIVHRDIHPGSLWWCEQRLPGPMVKLMDFGVARAFTEQDRREDPVTRQDATHAMNPELGAYQAPELFLQGLVSPQGDVFSVGLLWLSLLGQPLLENLSVRDIIQRHLYGLEIPEGVGGAAHSVLRRALQQSLAERYTDAEEMLRDIEPLLAASREQSASVGTARTASVVAQPTVVVSLDAVHGQASVYREGQPGQEVQVGPRDKLLLGAQGEVQLLRGQDL